MGSMEFNAIKSELKSVLKARNINYNTISAKLGLSESGIKKMLNAQDLSYNRIVSILEAAGVGVTEFFQNVGNAKPVEKKMTSKQEEFFIKNPDTYEFFYQLLVNDLDTKKIKADHNLSQKRLDQYLFQLDKIKAIELHPKGVIKSEYAGNIRLTYGFPLMKVVVDRQHQRLLDFAHVKNESFKGRKHLANGILKMTPETAGEFNQALRDVVSEYMMRSNREKIVQPENKLESIGFMVVVTPTQGMKEFSIS